MVQRNSMPIGRQLHRCRGIQGHQRKQGRVHRNLKEWGLGECRGSGFSPNRSLDRILVSIQQRLVRLGQQLRCRGRFRRHQRAPEAFTETSKSGGWAQPSLPASPLTCRMLSRTLGLPRFPVGHPATARRLASSRRPTEVGPHSRRPRRMASGPVPCPPDLAWMSRTPSRTQHSIPYPVQQPGTARRQASS